MYQNIHGYGPLARCPIKVVTTKTKMVMEIYKQCRNFTEVGPQANGILPVSGGMLSQPHTLMTAFGILDDAVMFGMREVRARKDLG